MFKLFLVNVWHKTILIEDKYALVRQTSYARLLQIFYVNTINIYNNIVYSQIAYFSDSCKMFCTYLKKCQGINKL